MAKLIVAGTRTVNNQQQVIDGIELGMRRLRLTWDQVEVLLHGDSRGVDKVAAAYAESKGIPVKPFPADWDGPLKKQAGPYRNNQMAEEGTHLIALWDGKSRGTQNMITSAWYHGRRIDVVMVDASRIQQIRLGNHIPSWVKKEVLGLTLRGQKGLMHLGPDPYGGIKMFFYLSVNQANFVPLPSQAGYSGGKTFMIYLPHAFGSEKYLRRCCGEFFARMTAPEGEELAHQGGWQIGRAITNGLPFSLTVSSEEMRGMSPETSGTMYREVAAHLYGILVALDKGRIQVDNVGYMPKTSIELFGTQRTVTYRPPSYAEVSHD